MKKKHLFLLLFLPFLAMGQRMKREQVFTFATSQSMTELFGTVIEELVNTVSYKDAKMSAGLVLQYDHCLRNRVSLGFGISHQALRLTYTDTTFYPNGTYIAQEYEDKVTRNNFGLRALYHLTPGFKDVDSYFGLRFSFTSWGQESSNPNITSGNWNFQDLFKSNRMKYQALFGFRYYPWKRFGFGTEFAVGPPYFLMVGMQWKWGKVRPNTVNEDPHFIPKGGKSPEPDYNEPK
ncbi:MAG: hypothetical protein IT233_00085 [Bacteroidia bacterium]|nr:hypothetical protein [Bacteroidia bacterium]